MKDILFRIYLVILLVIILAGCSREKKLFPIEGAKLPKKPEVRFYVDMNDNVVMEVNYNCDLRQSEQIKLNTREIKWFLDNFNVVGEYFVVDYLIDNFSIVKIDRICWYKFKEKNIEERVNGYIKIDGRWRNENEIIFYKIDKDKYKKQREMIEDKIRKEFKNKKNKGGEG